MQFHRCGQDQVVAEDLLFSIRILWVPANPNFGVSIFGQLGTAHDHCAIVEINRRYSRADGVDAQLLFFKFICDIEKDGRVFLFLSQFAIGKSELESK